MSCAGSSLCLSSLLRSSQAEDLSAFELRLEELLFEHRVPGASAGVVHRGELVWSRGFGHADLEEEVFAEPDTRYRLASVSKPFAAVLVMQLVEEGALSLDAPMRDFWIPTWFAPDPERYRQQPILLRHVLTHTSEGVPGAAYSYSGNCYADLTYVLEQVTGTSYARLVQERIFDRLGMADSVPGHARPGETTPVPMARPYVLDGELFERTTYRIMDPDPALELDGLGPVMEMPEEVVRRRKELLGERFSHLNAGNTASGLVSTVEDLARFDAALDAGTLIRKESVARLFTPAVSNEGAVLPYGLGWFVEEVEGLQVVWHYGWLPPTVSALYVKLPSRELTFLLLANCDRLSAGMAWSAEGVRASPFARAFLEAFGE